MTSSPNEVTSRDSAVDVNSRDGRSGEPGGSDGTSGIESSEPSPPPLPTLSDEDNIIADEAGIGVAEVGLPSEFTTIDKRGGKLRGTSSSDLAPSCEVGAVVDTGVSIAEKSPIPLIAETEAMKRKVSCEVGLIPPEDDAVAKKSCAVAGQLAVLTAENGRLPGNDDDWQCESENIFAEVGRSDMARSSTVGSPSASALVESGIATPGAFRVRGPQSRGGRGVSSALDDTDRSSDELVDSSHRSDAAFAYPDVERGEVSASQMVTTVTTATLVHGRGSDDDPSDSCEVVMAEAMDDRRGLDCRMLIRDWRAWVVALVVIAVIVALGVSLSLNNSGGVGGDAQAAESQATPSPSVSAAPTSPTAAPSLSQAPTFSDRSVVHTKFIAVILSPGREDPFADPNTMFIFMRVMEGYTAGFVGGVAESDVDTRLEGGKRISTACKYHGGFSGTTRGPNLHAINGEFAMSWSSVHVVIEPDFPMKFLEYVNGPNISVYDDLVAAGISGEVLLGVEVIKPAEVIGSSSDPVPTSAPTLMKESFVEVTYVMVLYASSKYFQLNSTQEAAFEALMEGYDEDYMPPFGLGEGGGLYQITTTCDVHGIPRGSGKSLDLHALQLEFAMSWRSRFVRVDAVPVSFADFVNSNLDRIMDDISEVGITDVLATDGIAVVTARPSAVPTPRPSVSQFPTLTDPSLSDGIYLIVLYVRDPMYTFGVREATAFCSLMESFTASFGPDLGTKGRVETTCDVVNSPLAELKNGALYVVNVQFQMMWRSPHASTDVYPEEFLGYVQKRPYSIPEELVAWGVPGVKGADPVVQAMPNVRI